VTFYARVKSLNTEQTRQRINHIILCFVYDNVELMVRAFIVHPLQYNSIIIIIIIIIQVYFRQKSIENKIR